MKTRILILLALFGMAGANQIQPLGSGNGIYLIGERDLYARMVRAQSYKDIFLQAGDTAWAAYYAGRESVYAEQLSILFVSEVPNPSLP